MENFWSTEILKFYNNEPNLSGMTFGEVVHYDIDQLEMKHDYIQWLFPTNHPSQFNLTAPVLTKVDINVLQHNSNFVIDLSYAGNKFYDTYINQYGVGFDLFCSGPNHNHFRVTRILCSLKLFNRPVHRIFSRLLFLKELGRLKTTQQTWNLWVEELK